MMPNTFTDQIDNILSNYYAEYERIFNVFDFSDNPDRFTEENQTVNFCRAVQSVFPDAVVWYEYPFKPVPEEYQDTAKCQTCDYRNQSKKDSPKKASSNRFDSVIYIPSCQTLLIVEAKCLRKHSKYEAMYNDLARICAQKDTNIKLHNQEITSIYAVILADYWKKGKHAQYYMYILSDWKKGLSDHYVGKESCFRCFKECSVKNLDKVNQYWDPPHSSPVPYSFSNSNYHLLSLIGKIK